MKKFFVSLLFCFGFTCSAFAADNSFVQSGMMVQSTYTVTRYTISSATFTTIPFLQNGIRRTYYVPTSGIDSIEYYFYKSTTTSVSPSLPIVSGFSEEDLYFNEHYLKMKAGVSSTTVIITDLRRY